MVWRRMGRLVLTVHSAKEPAENDWGRFLSEACQFDPLQEQRVLVVSAGGAPNPAQRRRLVEVLNGARPLTAVLTPSWLVRGAGTAVSWFNPNLRVFSPRESREANEYLQLTAVESDEGWQLILQLQRELGIEVVQSHREKAEGTD